MQGRRLLSLRRSSGSRRPDRIPWRQSGRGQNFLLTIVEKVFVYGKKKEERDLGKKKSARSGPGRLSKKKHVVAQGALYKDALTFFVFLEKIQLRFYLAQTCALSTFGSRRRGHRIYSVCNVVFLLYFWIEYSQYFCFLNRTRILGIMRLKLCMVTSKSWEIAHVFFMISKKITYLYTDSGVLLQKRDAVRTQSFGVGHRSLPKVGELGAFRLSDHGHSAPRIFSWVVREKCQKSEK